MRVLLDTCVVSELNLPRGDPAVRASMAAYDDTDIFLSALTLGELTKGIALLPASCRKRDLAAWLAGLERLHADRILGVDCETAVTWGEILARGQQAGTPRPAIDALLAATALRHGLHVVTRSTRHFQATGALIIDPWASAR